VTRVADGEAALQGLRAGARPDLVLLDLAMPGMDGYEFRRRQRREPAFSRLPVIVLTATSRVRDRQVLDAHAIFTKPVDFTVLCEAIGACLTARAASS
jgi:CheY-like chemotaxis protein